MSTPGPPQSPPPLIYDFVVAFEGNALSYIIYGVYVAVAITNLVLLGKKKNNVLFAFTLFQLVVTTLYNAIQLYSSPQQFLTTYNLAGLTYASILSPWPNVLIEVAYVVIMWTSDGFLVFRCYIVLFGNRRALALPALLYLVVVGSSIAALKFDVDPTATYSTRTIRVATLCYWSSSVALNVVASSIIAVRFWWLRRQIFRASPQQASFYLAYIALTLESALLYTAFAIAGLVVLAMNSTTLEAVFFTMLGPIQVLAPALIVNRIARGISIESDFSSSGMVGSIHYATPQHGRSTNGEFSLGAAATRRSSERGAKLLERPNDHSTSYFDNARPIV